ncbi:hypothetical protein ERJ75_001271900 [Trypanosoma vivax]|nr:hypothetical protein ERJ75_001271900 [Trypanosoma vivax]
MQAKTGKGTTVRDFSRMCEIVKLALATTEIVEAEVKRGEAALARLNTTLAGKNKTFPTRVCESVIGAQQDVTYSAEAVQQFYTTKG